MNAFPLADLVAVGTIILLAWVLVLLRGLRRELRLPGTAAEREPSHRTARLSAPAWVPGAPEAQESESRVAAVRRLAASEAIAGVIAGELESALQGGDLPAAARSSAARARRLARVAGGGRLREERTTLALVWPNVVERVRPGVAGDQTLRAQLPADLPPVAGSGEAWVEILTELVRNALDATRGGGMITVRAEAIGGVRVRVVVEDTGRGIRPEVLPHVMEPFYTSQSHAGAEGLGLATVASLVEGIGGTVRLASKPGAGTTAELEVPAASAVPAVSFAGYVLVADDDRLTREGMARLLESFGCTPVQCDSGTVARSLLLEDPGRFRLAVLDVVMPGTPVEEVVRAARGRAPELPVLFVSGYDTMRHVDAVLATGRVRFLRKPFTRQAFHQALSDLLAAPGASAASSGSAG